MIFYLVTWCTVRGGSCSPAFVSILKLFQSVLAVCPSCITKLECFIVATVAPIYPLISIYYEFWETQEALPKIESTAVYAMLVFGGIFFTIGSAAFIRAVDEVFFADTLYLYSFLF